MERVVPMPSSGLICLPRERTAACAPCTSSWGWHWPEASACARPRIKSIARLDALAPPGKPPDPVGERHYAQSGIDPKGVLVGTPHHTGMREAVAAVTVGVCMHSGMEIEVEGFQIDFSRVRGCVCG